MKKLRFTIILIIIFILLDVCLTFTNPVGTSTLYNLNDFEKTVKDHGNTAQYEKVFFGNSVVISAFIEEDSRSGYINMGLDYGKVTDIVEMLAQKKLRIEKDLVVGLNAFTLMDTLETNKTYPWHRKWYEPYVYFQRDRLSELINNGIENILSRKKFVAYRYDDLQKTVYHGILNDEELREKLELYESRYWSQGLKIYEKNLKALEKLIKYCEKNNIRLRFVWMPWNPRAELPGVVSMLMEKANEIILENGNSAGILTGGLSGGSTNMQESIKIYNMTNMFDAVYFHDVGHFDYETGAPKFTEEIDQWLMKNG